MQKAMRRGTAAWAALYVILSRINTTCAQRFFAGIETGEGLPSGSPILLLRQRLWEDTLNSKQQITTRYWAALVFKAWNAYRDHRSLRNLRWRTEGDNPEEYPTPR